MTSPSTIMTKPVPRILRSSNANDIRPFDATTSHVVMPDGSLVWVDNATLADFDRRGITARWSCYSNGAGRTYVAVNLPARLGGGSTTVAGLIVRHKPNEGVSYSNGNRFDLRRCNLIVTPRGPGRQRSMQAHAAILFPNDPERQAEWLQAADQRRKAQQEAARLAAEFRGVLPRPVRIVAASAVEG